MKTLLRALVVSLYYCITSGIANDDSRDYCLKYADAQRVANNYMQLQRNFSTDLAKAALSTDFILYSTSLNMLLNCGTNGPHVVIRPLAPTFTGRKEFIVGQSSQPPLPYTLVDMWYACDNVIIRYELPASSINFVNQTDTKPIIGMIDIRTVLAPLDNQYPHYIREVYTEFDLVSFLAYLGANATCAHDP